MKEGAVEYVERVPLEEGKRSYGKGDGKAGYVKANFSQEKTEAEKLVIMQERKAKVEESKFNRSFEDYFKYLNLFDNEKEWDAFYNKLKVPLDISFRINSIDKECEKTRMELFNYIGKL